MAENINGTSEAGAPVLRLRGISKNFGAVSALTDIDLDVHAGEVVALVGDNGAGKSTLIKVLAGVHQPTSGTVEFRGQNVTLDSPGRALDLGIATVFQDLALCENLDVVANLFLGHEMSPWRLDATSRARRTHPFRTRTGRLALGRAASDSRDRPLAPARSQAHHA